MTHTIKNPAAPIDLGALLQQELSEHRSTFEATALGLSDPFTKALELLAASLSHGGKLLLFGNGGSAADAQHLAAEFSGRFLRERGGLPSEALSVNSSAVTAIANDFGYEQVFARQVEAFAQPGDVVVGITTSGTSPNILRAMEAAKKHGATTVAFTGNGGGPLAKIADLVLMGPDGYSAIVQEVHITLGHIICDLVEQDLLFE
jgi:D-sedoheptulose 7-phosphate isomerase